MSLRAVSAALAEQGHLNERGKPFNPSLSPPCWPHERLCRCKVSRRFTPAVIGGGSGGAGLSGAAGAGGSGVANSGTMTTLTNRGRINGGKRSSA